MRSASSKSLFVAAVALVGLSGALYAAPPTPEQLLAGSIARHDPDGAWPTGRYRMEFRETRPDGASRDTTVVIDNRAGTFQISTLRDGDLIAGELTPTGCTWLVNGSPEFSDEQRERHRLTCERLERTRNYYTYLWGLPMKLRDPGTRIGESVAEKSFGDSPALELRVSYDEAVGKDVWYLYFDPADHDLIGYRFYHDEAANDGEYIELEGIQEGAGLRLPRTRTWYTHKEDKLLGTDTLISIERP